MAYTRPVKKQKPTYKRDIRDYLPLANEAGCENNHERALWIIDNTEDWRSRGYAETLKALNALTEKV